MPWGWRGPGKVGSADLSSSPSQRQGQHAAQGDISLLSPGCSDTVHYLLMGGATGLPGLMSCSAQLQPPGCLCLHELHFTYT